VLFGELARLLGLLARDGVDESVVLAGYRVELDAGGELVVARQNGASDLLPVHRGAEIRIAWRADQAFTISSSPGANKPGKEG